MSTINKEEGKPEEEKKEALEGTGTDGAAAVAPNAENGASKEGPAVDEKKEEDEDKDEEDTEGKPAEEEKGVSKALQKKFAKTEAALEKAKLEKKQVADRLAVVEKALAVERDARILKSFEEISRKDYVRIGKAEDLAPVLKEASEKLSVGTFGKLTDFLKGANAKIDAGTFVEVGKSGQAPGGSVVSKIHEIARGIVEKSSNMTMAQAEARAWELNPELYKQYHVELRGAQ